MLINKSTDSWFGCLCIHAFFKHLTTTITFLSMALESIDLLVLHVAWREMNESVCDGSLNYIYFDFICCIKQILCSYNQTLIESNACLGHFLPQCSKLQIRNIYWPLRWLFRIQYITFFLVLFCLEIDFFFTCFCTCILAIKMNK